MHNKNVNVKQDKDQFLHVHIHIKQELKYVNNYKQFINTVIVPTDQVKYLLNAI